MIKIYLKCPDPLSGNLHESGNLYEVLGLLFIKEITAFVKTNSTSGLSPKLSLAKRNQSFLSR